LEFRVGKQAALLCYLAMAAWLSNFGHGFSEKCNLYEEDKKF